MALMAVKSQEKMAPTLADRLAEAQRAEVRPRRRVAELSAAFDEALAAKRYADAARLQIEVAAAREALAVCEGTTRGLRQGLAVVEAERASQQAAIADAQRRDQAQRIIADAMQADQQALDAIQEAVAQTRACLGAARDAFARAQQWERKAGQERQRVTDARVALGELQFPAPPAPPSRTSRALSPTRTRFSGLVKWDRR